MNDNKPPIFTRYLYDKTEVKQSLLLAILEKQQDEALFWTYELYYSGFNDELIHFIWLIYNKIFIFTNKSLNQFIEKNMKLSEENPENGIYIGSIIATFIHREYNLIPFIEEFFKVKCVKKDITKQKTHFNINLKETDIIQYQTTTNICPNNVLKKMNKYSIRKYANRLFDTELPNQEDLNKIYRIHWLYYAYQCPIWKQRIDKYEVIVDDERFSIYFKNENEEEEFYDNWGYDPEEQPEEVYISHIGLGNEYQYNIMDFCKKFNIEIITKKIKLRINPQQPQLH